MAAQVDLVLVIGADNSSNCNRLREVAESAGVPAYLIDDAGGLRDEWLEGVEHVGITSGASTPEYLVQDIINRLQPEEVVRSGHGHGRLYPSCCPERCED